LIHDWRSLIDVVEAISHAELERLIGIEIARAGRCAHIVIR
jgi:hypothetical protein